MKVLKLETKCLCGDDGKLLFCFQNCWILIECQMRRECVRCRGCIHFLEWSLRDILMCFLWSDFAFFINGRPSLSPAMLDFLCNLKGIILGIQRILDHHGLFILPQSVSLSIFYMKATLWLLHLQSGDIGITAFQILLPSSIKLILWYTNLSCMVQR